jgi:hypothetical protein
MSWSDTESDALAVGLLSDPVVRTRSSGGGVNAPRSSPNYNRARGQAKVRKMAVHAMRSSLPWLQPDTIKTTALRRLVHIMLHDASTAIRSQAFLTLGTVEDAAEDLLCACVEHQLQPPSPLGHTLATSCVSSWHMLLRITMGQLKTLYVVTFIHSHELTRSCASLTRCRQHSAHGETGLRATSGLDGEQHSCVACGTAHTGALHHHQRWQRA